MFWWLNIAEGVFKCSLNLSPKVLIIPEQNGTFSIGVYRKPTHTDLYLPWDSNHNLSAKYSVIKTLTHRAHTICSTPKLLQAELNHLEEALGHCKYPKWAIKKVFKQQQLRKENKHKPRTTNKSIKRSHIVIPYVPSICESIKNIGKKYGVAVYFKGNRTLKNILLSPKDKDEMANKSSIIYSYCCGEIDCNEEYVGESGRTKIEEITVTNCDQLDSNIKESQWHNNISASNKKGSDTLRA